MKKLVISVISILLAAATLCLSACGVEGKSELLGSPKSTTSLPFSERKESGFLDINSSANAFAYDFSEQAYSKMGGRGNLAFAPVSVYMALSVAAECAAEQTREEIVTALGVSYDNLKNNFAKLYRSLIFEDSDEGRLTGKLSLTNSVWLNSGMEEFSVKNECVNSLSNNFFCYSYSADFTNLNKQANQAIKEFVKKQTNNLVNRDFNISKDISFLLMNTLYLKDLWNPNGDDLKFADKKYDFTSSGGVKPVKLLNGYYSVGRTYEDETFTHYYTSTTHGYKIKFILPKDGYSVADVFTAENIEKVNKISDYNALDEENLIRYNTRCLFPEFSASFDGDVKSVLKNHFNINSMFDLELSNFSTISDINNFCSEVRHTTSLTVNKKGIEGAAVTRVAFAGAPGPDEYEDKYIDFVVDRAFGYVITDSYNTVVFTGAVNGI